MFPLPVFHVFSSTCTRFAVFFLVGWKPPAKCLSAQEEDPVLIFSLKGPGKQELVFVGCTVTFDAPISDLNAKLPSRIVCATDRRPAFLAGHEVINTFLLRVPGKQKHQCTPLPPP